MGNKYKCKGEVDYDYKYDILFFKTKEREYFKSLEFDNIVVDILQSIDEKLPNSSLVCEAVV